MPVYLVICQVVSNAQQYYMLKMLKVVECTLDSVGEVSNREMARYYGTAINVISLIFEREPENPFRNIALTK